MTTGHRLPFSDTAAILVANNKDEEVQQEMQGKFDDLLALLGEKSYLNKLLRKVSWDTSLPLGMVSKFLFYLVTVYLGVRTPGQEFADVSITSNFEDRPSVFQKLKRLAYILGHSGGVDILQKLVQKYFKINESFTETFAQLHLATFYLNSKYRSLWDRLFGFRYVLQHDFYDDEEREYRSTYGTEFRFVGKLILLRLAYKKLYPTIHQWVSDTLNSKRPSSLTDKKLTQSTEASESQIDLSDALQLTYIPEGSRTCILCSSEMVSPSCGPCGHVFCWTCVIEWCKTKKNCPLCRQACLPQEVIPLR